MKKTYVSPLASEVSVTTDAMIAASLQKYEAEVNTKTEGVQLGKDNRGQWGNLWAK